RNTLPAPRSPAATAPCTASGAPVYVSRAARALGVRPWSASDTRTASTIRRSPRVGSRRVTSRKASSVNVRWPITSLGRSRAPTVMRSGSDEPILVRNHSGPSGPDGRGSANVDLLGGAFAPETVLGEPSGRRVRQLVDDLEVTRDLE